MKRSRVGGGDNRRRVASNQTLPRKRKHAPPPRGRVDEKAQRAALDKICRDEHGKGLNEFDLKKNTAPGTWSRSKQKLCTPEMAKMMAVYVMSICFSYEMVETSLFCAWWWWPFLPLVAWWKRYGWGIWSGAVHFSQTSTGGCRPLMIALGWVGAMTDWTADLYLGTVAKQSLAMILGCSIDLLPDGLKIVPCYGTLTAVCFHAYNLFFPVLYVTVACTKRGERICALLGYSEDATRDLLSGLVFLSKTARDNGVEYKLPQTWLGHRRGKKLAHVIMFCCPSARLVDGRLIYFRIAHDKPTLDDNEAMRSASRCGTGSFDL